MWAPFSCFVVSPPRGHGSSVANFTYARIQVCSSSATWNGRDIYSRERAVVLPVSGGGEDRTDHRFPPDEAPRRAGGQTLLDEGDPPPRRAGEDHDRRERGQ